MAIDEAHAGHEAQNGEPEARKPNRRRFIKTAAAATGATLATTYVKPNLKTFGVPTAMAQSALVSGCNGKLDIQDYTGNKVYNTICGYFALIHNAPPSGLQNVTSVTLTVRGGSCGSPSGAVLASLNGTTGACKPQTPIGRFPQPVCACLDPLQVGMKVPDCYSPPNFYGFFIDGDDLTPVLDVNEAPLNVLITIVVAGTYSDTVCVDL
jgi:hypothetical protein